MTEDQRRPGFARDLLLPLTDRRAVPTGRLIHAPDAPSDRFWLIEEGAVRFTTLEASGAEHEVFVLGAGEWFGEIALFSGAPPPHRASAASPCVLRSLDGAALREAMAAAPVLAEWLLARLARKLGYAFEMLEMTRSRTPEERVLEYLGWLAANGLARRTEDGRAAVAVSQEAMAGRLGLSRSTVADAYRTLRERGLIETRYGEVVFGAPAGPS